MGCLLKQLLEFCFAEFQCYSGFEYKSNFMDFLLVIIIDTLKTINLTNIPCNQFNSGSNASTFVNSSLSKQIIQMHLITVDWLNRFQLNSIQSEPPESNKQKFIIQQFRTSQTIQFTLTAFIEKAVQEVNFTFSFSSKRHLIIRYKIGAFIYH